MKGPTQERSNLPAINVNRHLSSDDLKNHEGTHRGEKPFACTKCEQTSSDDLKNHVGTHTGDKSLLNSAFVTDELGDRGCLQPRLGYRWKALDLRMRTRWTHVRFARVASGRQAASSLNLGSTYILNYVVKSVKGYSL